MQASVLSRIHHRNLVGLVGFCKDNKVLGVVYEYVAQGSLRDNLSGTKILKMKKESFQVGVV